MSANGTFWGRMTHLRFEFNVKVPDDTAELKAERTASEERLVEAQNLLEEVKPMTETLREHFKHNHYGERLAISYGRRTPQ